MKKIFLCLIIIFLLSVVGVAADIESEAWSYYSYNNANLIGSDPEDLSPNGRDLINEGATTGATGILEQAFSYATNDYLNYSLDYQSTFAEDQAFCVSTWINSDTTSVGDWNVIWSNSNGGNSRFQLGLRDGYVRVTLFDGVGFRYSDRGNAISTGTWYHVLVNNDGTNNPDVYIDTVLGATSITTDQINGNRGQFVIGGINDGGMQKFWEGEIDETLFLPRECTSQERSDLYNGGAGYDPFAGAATSNVTFTIRDEWDLGAIANVSVTINNTVYSNATGNKIYTTIPENASAALNMNFTGQDYFSKYDVSINLTSQTVELFQTQYRFNASQLYTNASLNATFWIDGNAYNVVNLTAGNYNVTGEVDTYFNITQEITATALDNLTIEFEGFYNAILNVSAYDFFADTDVDTFNITATNTLFSVEGNDSGTGTASIGLLQGYNYTISWSKTAYLPEETNLTINDSYTFYNFSVFGLVNVQFNFFDEVTLDPINNVSFQVLSDVFSNTFNTGANNNYLLTSLPESIYEIRYSVENYSTRSYYVLIPLTDSDGANLSLYSLEEDESTLFLRIITDQGNNPLTGYFLQVQRPYPSTDNSSLIYQTVEIALIDSQAEAVFNAKANTQQYRFRILDPLLQLANTLAPSYLIDSSANIIGTESENTMEDFNTATDTTSSLTYQNSTTSWIFDYTAPATIYQACLVVDNTTGVESSTQETCSTSNSDTITITIDPDLNTSYTATAYIYTDSATKFVVQTDSKDFSFKADLNTMRYIGAFLYLITMLIVIGIAGFRNPIGSISMGIMATAAFSLSFLGLFAFSTYLTGGLLIVGIIILLYSRESML